jgi:DNA-directed RNA polymerase subunit RPC12/RpoP
MAIYECLRCGTRREADHRGDGDRTCPDCGGPLRDIALPQE